MRLRISSLVGPGVLILWIGCITTPPDLEEALDLYREGKINEARRDLVAYLRAKPFNPESEEARQHIILIRRIKQLESIAVEQWRRGNCQGATKLVGIMRILHPVYVDSTKIFQLVDFSQPPKWAAAAEAAVPPEPSILAEADSIPTVLIPHMLDLLDRQQELLIILSREWEAVKSRPVDDPIGCFAASVRAPEIQAFLEKLTMTHSRLRQVTARPNRLSTEGDLLSEQLHQFLAYLATDTSLDLLSYEYGFQSQKRNLLMRILSLKARLVHDDTKLAGADSPR